MSLLRRLACAARGGHRWETTTDVVGSITVCGRCGKLRHAGSMTPESVQRAADMEAKGGGSGGD